jgi:predicted metal-dependent hydrolase
MSPKTSERNRLPPLSETEKLEALAKGVREFNSWRFYDCHETLEDVWRAEDGRLADFFQGIIKIAAGFHHLLRGNHRGAINLLGHALTLLAPYRPACLGVDIGRLIDEASACYERLRGLGPKRIDEFDRSKLPRIKMEGL